MSAPSLRIGVLGGTFDPPHIGHLLSARYVQEALSLDEVLLVVANEPWQKVGSRVITPAGDRLAMVRAAAEGHPRITASDIEIERGGPSYSIDTLEHLRKTYPGSELFLIVGADAAAGLSTWERASELPGLAGLAIVDREGAPEVDPPFDWSFVRVAVPRVDVSSSDLRERAAAGLSLEWSVPDAVIDVISGRRLYGLGAP